jgi:hypothetical protein
MKERKPASVLLMGLLVFSAASCSFVQKGLTFKILAPQGGDGLSFASYYSDEENVSFLESEDVYQAFFSNEYEAIIFDLDKGINLIQDHHAPFKLARVNTYGNAYLLGHNKDSDSSLNASSEIVSWNYAQQEYVSSGAEGRGIQNNLFRYFYNFSEDTSFIDNYFSNLKEEYQALLDDKEGKIDYAILPEPFVSLLLKNDPSYTLLYSFADKFQTKSSETGLIEGGYAHYPQTGLFIRNTWDTTEDKEKKGLYENFFTSIDNMLEDLERNNGGRVSSYLYDAYLEGKEDNVIDDFGMKDEIISDALNGNKNTLGINALGFCSYPLDLESFYQRTSSQGSRIFLSQIDASSYSTYYNK